MPALHLRMIILQVNDSLIDYELSTPVLGMHAESHGQAHVLNGELARSRIVKIIWLRVNLILEGVIKGQVIYRYLQIHRRVLNALLYFAAC